MDPLLSPTKARHAAIQAKDWAYVSAWLTKKYHPKAVPPFEHNDDTLKALLALVAANDAADEQAELMRRAQAEELEILEQHRLDQRAEADPCKEVLDEVVASLDEQGLRSLDELAETGVLLGTLSTDPVDMGHRIIEITRERHDAENHLRKISGLQARLEREMNDLRGSIEALKEAQNAEVVENLQQKTALSTREAKQISIKLNEYQERIASLDRQSISGPRIEDVKTEEKKILQRQKRVKALEMEVASFHGLPPDLEAAKGEYHRAQKELEFLLKRRDDLFEGLVKS